MDEEDFEDCLDQFADKIADLELELEEANQNKYIFYEVGKNFVNYMKWLRSYSPSLEREIKETMDEYIETIPKPDIVKKDIRVI